MIIAIALFSLLSTSASADGTAVPNPAAPAKPGVNITLPAPPSLVVSPVAVDDMQLTMPGGFGGTQAIIVDGCASTLAANMVVVGKMGDFMIDAATAHRICQEADGDFLQAQAEAWAILAAAAQQLMRAPGESALLASAGKELEDGGNIRVESPDLLVEGGDHLEWGAMADAMMKNQVSPDSHIGRRFVDIRALEYGRMGFMEHPAMPGDDAPVAEPTAPCGTAARCYEKIQALSSALAKKD